MRWGAVQIAPGSPQCGAALFALRAIRRATGRYGRRQEADRETVHYVCHRYGFVLTAIPKVGTRSFQTLLALDRRFHAGVEMFECPAEQMALYDRYFRFSFVRNPWDRVRSCYEDKIRFANDLGKLSLLSRYGALAPGMRFDQFVEWLASPDGADQCADRHWISQHCLLPDGYHIGKLETVSEDMNRFFEFLGVGAVVVPVRNRAKARQHDDYRSYYSDRTRELIGERYAEDVHRYGYTF
jgi:Sulfotransferase family